MESVPSTIPFDNFKIDLTFPGTDFQVRVVGSPLDPRWVAADVCKVLGISKPENAYARLDDDEKGTRTVGTPGGPQQMTVVNESGLYALIFTSRKPEAKRFKKWVTSEVLPSIRRYGQYPPPPAQYQESVALIQQSAMLAQLVRENHQNQLRIAEVEDTANSAKGIAQAAYETVLGCHDFMAVSGFCSLTKISCTETEAQQHGKHLTKLCKNAGLQTGTVRHVKYGSVKTYPIEVMEGYFGVKLPN